MKKLTAVVLSAVLVGGAVGGIGFKSKGFKDWSKENWLDRPTQEEPETPTDPTEPDTPDDPVDPTPPFEGAELTSVRLESTSDRVYVVFGGRYGGEYSAEDFAVDVQETSGSWSVGNLGAETRLDNGEYTVKSDVTGLFANRYIFHLTVKDDTANNDVKNIESVEKSSVTLSNKYTLDVQDVFNNGTDYYAVIVVENIVTEDPKTIQKKTLTHRKTVRINDNRYEPLPDNYITDMYWDISGSDLEVYDSFVFCFVNPKTADINSDIFVVENPLKTNTTSCSYSKSLNGDWSVAMISGSVSLSESGVLSLYAHNFAGNVFDNGVWLYEYCYGCIGELPADYTEYFSVNE